MNPPDVARRACVSFGDWLGPQQPEPAITDSPSHDRGRLECGCCLRRAIVAHYDPDRWPGALPTPANKHRAWSVVNHPFGDTPNQYSGQPTQSPASDHDHRRVELSGQVADCVRRSTPQEVGATDRDPLLLQLFGDPVEHRLGAAAENLYRVVADRGDRAKPIRGDLPGMRQMEILARSDG